MLLEEGAKAIGYAICHVAFVAVEGNRKQKTVLYRKGRRDWCMNLSKVAY